MQKGHKHSSGLKCVQIAEVMDISFPLVHNCNVLSPHLKKGKKKKKNQTSS